MLKGLNQSLCGDISLVVLSHLSGLGSPLRLSLLKVWCTQMRTSAAQTLTIQYIPIYLIFKNAQMEITIPLSLQARLRVTMTGCLATKSWSITSQGGCLTYIQDLGIAMHLPAGPRSDFLTAIENADSANGPDLLRI